MKSIFLALGIVALSQSPQQFDLLCKGTQETINLGQTPTQHYEKRYRLDLAKGKFCINECTEGLSDFPQVTDRLIYFEKKESAGPPPSSVSNFVNRQTGKHSALAQDGQSVLSAQGMCELQPFSGFPQIKTKF